MNELALFAGVGGGLLASKLARHRIVCYVEWNDYCVEVLKARIRDGYLDDAPIWDDCFTFDGRPWAGHVDIISAGFPCQPFSQDGKGLAENDPRNGWPTVKRIVSEVRPRFVFLENVPGLVSKPYIRRVFGDLAEIRYDAEWGIVSASAVGASHKRERIWIVAYANNQRCPELNISNFTNGSSQSHRRTAPKEYKDWQFTQSPICGGNDDVAHRVDRLAAIGNGQVPAVARTAWELLIKRMNENI